jgi:tetratricopeptide (TPR) repeat protein
MRLAVSGWRTMVIFTVSAGTKPWNSGPNLAQFRPLRPLGNGWVGSLADRETRLISPSALVTVADYVERRIEDDSLESLTQVLRIAPLNPQILSRLGRKLMIADSTRVTQQDRAEWLTRLALELAPEDPSVWWLRADVLQALDRLDEARFALSKALEMAPEDPNALFSKALLFHRNGEFEAAYETYVNVLDRLTENDADLEPAQGAYLQERLRELRSLGGLDAEKCLDLSKRKRVRQAMYDQIEADWLLRKAGHLSAQSKTTGDRP